MSKVLESAKFIAANSQDVKVSTEGCAAAAEKVHESMLQKHYSTSSWSQHPLNPDPRVDDPVKVVDWIFTVDLLNFSFWSDYDSKDSGKSASDRFTVEYKGEHYTGYWSLCAAINKALDAGVPITTPSQWASLDLAKVFESHTKEEIPLLRERIQVLQEAGQVMNNLGYDHFASFVQAANGSAMRLLDMLTTSFPSFDDTSVYQGRKVHIHKRAQILISDIWACFNGKSYGEFNDIDQITMFADYRVPQILKNLGCLEYSDALTDHLISLKPLDHHDPREVELRGCSIWAVEVVKQAIMKAHPQAQINSILLDFYLWDTAKEMQKQHGGNFDVPCHRTRSIFY